MFCLSERSEHRVIREQEIRSAPSNLVFVFDVTEQVQSSNLVWGRVGFDHVNRVIDRSVRLVGHFPFLECSFPSVSRLDFTRRCRLIDCCQRGVYQRQRLNEHPVSPEVVEDSRQHANIRDPRMAVEMRMDSAFVYSIDSYRTDDEPRSVRDKQRLSRISGSLARVERLESDQDYLQGSNGATDPH